MGSRKKTAGKPKIKPKKDFKPKKLHGKSKKTFIHKKYIKSNSHNGKSNSKQFQYTPEVGEIPPVEVQFAKKLAANEPAVRDKAIKKLKKWLMSRSSICDGEVSKATFNDSEMLRLWKGLHYCFWMSDKPLVQEELAEKIASIIHCFKTHEESALLYLECFLMTLGREWIGIDKHRMDKFMMLTRRMMRQSFVYVAEKNWDCKLIENMANVFELVVLSANRIQNNASIALGFQLHFTDLYLEELAKASKMTECQSEMSLTDESIQIFLKPFVNELAKGKEDRLLSQIEIRIFDHLIRQSDVALEYEDDDEEEQDDIVTDSEHDDLTEHKNTVDKDEEELFSLEDADPRAGTGDFILPQINVNSVNMAKILLEAGSKKEVSKQQRQRMYRITKRFNHLAAGVYPFALEMTDDGERLIDEKEFEEQERNLKKEEKNSAKRKMGEDKENAANVREERKAYRVAIKKRIKMENEYKEENTKEQSATSEPGVNTDAENMMNGEENAETNSKKKNKSKDKPVKHKGSKHLDPKNIKLKENSILPIENNEATKSVKPSKRKVLLDVSNTEERKTEENGSNSASDENLKETQAVKPTSHSKVLEVNRKDQKLDRALGKNVIETEEALDKSASMLSNKKKRGKNNSENGEPIKAKKIKHDVLQSDDVSQKQLKKQDVPESESTYENTSESSKKKKKAKKNIKKDKKDDASVQTQPKLDNGVNDDSLNDEHLTSVKGCIEKSTKNTNMFKVSDDWDEQLKEVKTKIFDNNAKSSKNAKSSNTCVSTPPSEKKKKKKAAKEKKIRSDEVYGIPSITTPDKLPTPVFVKKAISKSGTDHILKKNKHIRENLTHSEPKHINGTDAKRPKTDKAQRVSKRINFAMSENKCQSLRELDISIQQSPNFQPYDASKKPAKGPILKTTPNGSKTSENVTPIAKKKKQTVLYNTMLNSKSKFARRMVASDYF